MVTTCLKGWGGENKRLLEPLPLQCEQVVLWNSYKTDQLQRNLSLNFKAHVSICTLHSVSPLQFNTRTVHSFMGWHSAVWLDHSHFGSDWFKTISWRSLDSLEDCGFHYIMETDSPNKDSDVIKVGFLAETWFIFWVMVFFYLGFSTSLSLRFYPHGYPVTSTAIKFVFLLHIPVVWFMLFTSKNNITPLK